MIWFGQTSRFCLVNQSQERFTSCRPLIFCGSFLFCFFWQPHKITLCQCYPVIFVWCCVNSQATLCQPSPQKSQATCYPSRRTNRLSIDCRSDHFVCRRCCPLVDGFKPTRPSGERVSTRPGRAGSNRNVVPPTEPHSWPWNVEMLVQPCSPDNTAFGWHESLVIPGGVGLRRWKPLGISVGWSGSGSGSCVCLRQNTLKTSKCTLKLKNANQHSKCEGIDVIG